MLPLFTELVPSGPTLAQRPKTILTYIDTFTAGHGFPPTVREIRDGLGLSSTSVVKYHLDALETDGWITRQSRAFRGIRILRLPA